MQLRNYKMLTHSLDFPCSCRTAKLLREISYKCANKLLINATCNSRKPRRSKILRFDNNAILWKLNTTVLRCKQQSCIFFYLKQRTGKLCGNFGSLLCWPTRSIIILLEWRHARNLQGKRRNWPWAWLFLFLPFSQNLSINERTWHRPTKSCSPWKNTFGWATPHPTF